MRVAFLVSMDTPPSRQAIEAVARTNGVEVVGILVDVAKPSSAQRRRNLARNVKRNGLSYLPYRLLRAVQDRLESACSAPLARNEASDLMRRAFPEEAFSFGQLAQKLNVPLFQIQNLNSPEAAARLKELAPDLGVVVGTRILKPSTFTVPRLGCINLHKGKVPEYRGMPPAFWELYEGALEAGVTVHFLDAGLDTGDIVAARTVPVHRFDTLSTLQHKLNDLGTSTLADAVAQIANGTFTRTPQATATLPARTLPTRRQVAELAARAPQHAALNKSLPYQIFKTLFYLGLSRSGFLHLVRKFRRDTQAAVLLYHRVDDFSDDPLTVSRERFAEQLCALRHHYEVRSTEWLVERLEKGEPIPPRTVVIHFDDCYESVASAAGPLLKAAGAPAMHFINSGFVGTSRKLAHDERRYPLDYANLTAEQVRQLADQGISVGAHTVNHRDLGVTGADETRREMADCRTELEALTGYPVDVFSFPHGRPENFQEEYYGLAQSLGFRAVFSAHGGRIGPRTTTRDIPRMGVSGELSPVYLLAEVEGFGLWNVGHAVSRTRLAMASFWTGLRTPRTSGDAARSAGSAIR